MKKTKPKLSEGDLRRYDWSKAARGKLADKAARASMLLRILEPDLSRRFPDSRSVNEALRALLTLEEALPRRRPHSKRAA
jgi:hypothetical protein